MAGAEGTIYTCGNRGSNVICNLLQVTKSMPACLGEHAVSEQTLRSSETHGCSASKSIFTTCMWTGKTGIALAPISQIRKLRPAQATLLT